MLGFIFGFTPFHGRDRRSTMAAFLPDLHFVDDDSLRPPSLSPPRRYFQVCLSGDDFPSGRRQINTRLRGSLLFLRQQPRRCTMLKWVPVLFSALFSSFTSSDAIFHGRLIKTHLCGTMVHLPVAFSLSMFVVSSPAEACNCRNIHYWMEWRLRPAMGQ